jgi:hypothetical protein
MAGFSSPFLGCQFLITGFVMQGIKIGQLGQPYLEKPALTQGI